MGIKGAEDAGLDSINSMSAQDNKQNFANYRRRTYDDHRLDDEDDDDDSDIDDDRYMDKDEVDGSEVAYTTIDHYLRSAGGRPRETKFRMWARRMKEKREERKRERRERREERRERNGNRRNRKRDSR